MDERWPPGPDAVLDLSKPELCRMCGRLAYRDETSNIWYHLQDHSHRVIRGRIMRGA